MKKISIFILQMIICGTLTSGVYAQLVQTQYVAQPVQPQYVAQPVQPQYVAQPVQTQYVAQPVQPQYVAQPVQPQYVAQPVQPQYVAQPVQPQYVAQYVAQPQYIAPVPIKEKDIQKENKFGFSFDLNPSLTNATIGFDYGMFGISLAGHSNILYRKFLTKEIIYKMISNIISNKQRMQKYAPGLDKLNNPLDYSCSFDVIKILLNIQPLNNFSILCGVDIPINDTFLLHSRESMAFIAGFSFTSKPINQSGFYSSLSFIWTIKSRTINKEMVFKLVPKQSISTSFWDDIEKETAPIFRYLKFVPDVFLTIGYKFVI